MKSDGKMRRWWPWLSAVLLLCGAAVAGNVVDQGTPGNQGPWPIKCISGCNPNIMLDGGIVLNVGVVTVDGGSLTAFDPPCTSPKDTFFIPSTTDGGACPPTALSGRRSVLLCNAVKNAALGTPIVTVTVDGQAPNAGQNSPGQDLNVGDCIRYDVPDTTTTRCISDTVDAGLKITECK